MTMPRSKIVDLSVTRFYHCITGCVRQEPLCGEGNEHRKFWIEERLKALTGVFAIGVGSYAILDSHLHVVVYLDGPELVATWSDFEVVRRWATLFPPRDQRRNPLPITDEWVREMIRDAKWVKETRRRLSDLGWFMKCLKEPLARMANQEDGTRGAFFASRYKSIAILDLPALLATCVYADLNPFAAGIAIDISNSPFTSLKTRVDFCRTTDRLAELGAAATLARKGCVVPAPISRALEDGVWVMPMDASAFDGRAGVLEGFTLAHYLTLVDTASRVKRDGKQHQDVSAAGILERLGIDEQNWTVAVNHLLTENRHYGLAYSFSRDRLRAAATQFGRNRMANLNGHKCN